MLKYISVFTIIGIIACASTTKVEEKITTIKSQINLVDKILWSSDYKLGWNDFKGENVGDFDFRKAETSTIIETVKTYYNDDNIPVYEIACYFLPKKSWTITSEQFALEHEQLHFDIGELYTRKIRKTFDSLNNENVKDFNKYENVFNSLNSKCSDYNNLYDSEVYQVKNDNTVKYNHDKQKEWSHKIKKQLQDLNNYQYKID